MLKKSLAIVSVFGILTLMGAGCGETSQNTTPTNGENTTSTPSESETTTTPGDSSVFGVKVVSLGEGKVKVEWTVPEDIDKASRIKVMHASRAGSDRPFWFSYPNSISSTEVKVPTGTRYFSVCELKNNVCVRTSTEVEVEVK